ncbi:MAG: hypothetical protein IKJ39_10665 [Lachnospiraceae bacterium]|nr:hypothetical protein [Lachnospiraceae bacterium]
MKERNIFVFLLSGLLMVGLTACGDNSEDTGDIAIEDVITIENGQMKVDEEKLEEVVEQIVEESWSIYFDESLKPVFDVHPVLRGKEVTGYTLERVGDVLGEPDIIDGNTPIYIVANENGAELQVRLGVIGVYARDEEGNVIVDESGRPVIGSYKVDDVHSRTSEGNDQILDRGKAIRLYAIGNKNYEVTTQEAFETFVKMYSEHYGPYLVTEENVNNPPGQEIYGYTYTMMSELLGTPGFLFDVNDDGISVMWIYQGEVPKCITVDFDKNGNCVGFGDYNEIEIKK